MNVRKDNTPPQNITARLTKGAVWIAATRISVNLIGLASTLLLARLLIPADFGLVAIATTITSVISSLTELSLASALVHHPDPKDSHYNGAFTLNLARAVVISLLILLLAIPISRIYHDPRLIGIMVAISSVTALGGLANPKMILFARNLVFWQDGVLNVSQRVVGFGFAAVVAYCYRSYWALIISMLATQIAAVAVSYILVPHRPRLRLAGVRELLSFSVWLSLGQAVNTLNWKFDHLVIGYFLGKSPLGFYTIGDNLAVLPTREATTPIAQTLFPGFSKVKGDPNRLRAVYQKGQSLLCSIALPVGFGFIFICRPLILITIGVKWIPAIFIIQLLSGIFALQTLSSAVQPLAMALGETKDLFYRDLINLVIRIPLIVVGLVFGGLPGIVYARCVAGVASTIVNMAMVRRLLSISIAEQLNANRRALLSTGLMTASGIFLSSRFPNAAGHGLLIGEIIVLCCVGAAIYSVASLIMWLSAGRPQGPEREVTRILAGILGSGKGVSS